MAPKRTPEPASVATIPRVVDAGNSLEAVDRSLHFTDPVECDRILAPIWGEGSACPAHR